MTTHVKHGHTILLPQKLEGLSPRVPLSQKALQNLLHDGLPTPRVEEWKYTNLKPLTDRPIERKYPGELPPLPQSVCDETSIFNNGVLNGGSTDLSWQENWFEVKADNARLADFNAAGAQNSYSLDLNGHAEAEITLINHGANALSCPRLQINVKGENTLFIRNLSFDNVWAVPLIQLNLAKGARLNLLVLSDGEGPAASTGTLITTLAKGAELNHTHLTCTKGLTRFDLFTKHIDSKSAYTLGALSLLGRTAHADITSRIQHMFPGSTSNVINRNVVDDKAMAVYQGKYVVDAKAQKTDANMLIKNLLLSDTARANTKPELEIFADDVKCTHGATTGNLSADELFYMQSRGLNKQDAKRLLIHGFAAEVLDTIQSEPLRTFAMEHVDNVLESLA